MSDSIKIKARLLCFRLRYPPMLQLRWIKGYAGQAARNDGSKKNPPDMYLQILVQFFYIALLAYGATRKGLD
jgi:hypothetical protein